VARAWCRATLPTVSRTFALNIQLLSGSMRDAVRIAYLLCRVADTIEDAWPGDHGEIQRRFEQLIVAVHGDAVAACALASGAAALEGRASEAHAALVHALPTVLRCFAELDAGDRADIAEAVSIMARGMARYAGRAAERAHGDSALVAYLDDERELRDYCWVVAGCVGVMLTRLHVRRAGAHRDDAAQLALAPLVGEGLQLTNILLDWPTDVRAGRCHLPASWLAEAGLTTADLAGGTSTSAIALARRLEGLARDALSHVPEYVATIPARFVRYRQFCLWPALWAEASLDVARATPGFPLGPQRPKLPRRRLARLALASLVRGHTARDVGRLFAMPR